MARHGPARLGEAWPGLARLGFAIIKIFYLRLSTARQGMARHSLAWLGETGHGVVLEKEEGNFCYNREIRREERR